MIPFFIHTRRFPPRQYHAITLFPFVFYNGGSLGEHEKRHEVVHVWQQLALLFVFFYLLYLIFWIRGLVLYRDVHRAYREIPFEKSAYMLENTPNVTPLRQSFHWLECIKPDIE